MEDMLDSDDNKSAEVDVPRHSHKAMHIFKKKLKKQPPLGHLIDSAFCLTLQEIPLWLALIVPIWTSKEMMALHSLGGWASSHASQLLQHQNVSFWYRAITFNKLKPAIIFNWKNNVPGIISILTSFSTATHSASGSRPGIKTKQTIKQKRQIHK